jgi:GDP-L-fucose synthase
MVGSAICRKLEKEGYTNLIGRTSKELDLRNQQAVIDFFESEKPEVVINAAARVGGILANNDYPYQFLMENLQIQNNLIDTSHKAEVEKFIFLGSSCIYPKHAPQPLKEEYLLTDSLEPTNEWYAIAKIAGVPAMIRKFQDARENGNTPVSLWGSGKPMREFLFVDDLADAVCFALENKLEENLYNVGTGVDITIKELAETIQEITGHKGEIIWDNSKPDGTPRKLMDVSKMKNAGWQASTNLEDGIQRTYKWFLQNSENYKQVKL